MATDEKKMVTGADAAKAKVTGKIVSQGRHPKQTVFKYRCIKQYKIVRGHRQNYTAVEVSGTIEPSKYWKQIAHPLAKSSEFGMTITKSQEFRNFHGA